VVDGRRRNNPPASEIECPSAASHSPDRTSGGTIPHSTARHLVAIVRDLIPGKSWRTLIKGYRFKGAAASPGSAGGYASKAELAGTRCRFRKTMIRKLYAFI